MMGIRSTAKAIIVHDGKVLLNKCGDKVNGEYYALPGGGQYPYETLPDALVRECLEETGYIVKPVRLAALCEEICMNMGFREKYPDYAHKTYHIFICELAKEKAEMPTETDSMQLGVEWVGIGSLKDVRLLPKLVGENIRGILDNTADIFLGSEHLEFNHG